jgi:magnesium transporter
MSGETVELESLLALAREGRLEALASRAPDLEPADLADVLAELGEEDRVRLIAGLPAELVGQALPEMPQEAHAEETLAALPAELAAELVEEMADDDAAALLAELDSEDQERILAEVEHRAEVDRLLSYERETAGGRMTSQVVAVLDSDSADQALQAIRRQAQAEEVADFYEIFVVDRYNRLLGVLPIKDLLLSPPGSLAREVMREAAHTVPPDLDQEEVARVMARYNLAGVPVVDPDGRLLGAVTFDDVQDVIEAENTEDILQFGGTSADEELAGRWHEAVRSRLPWLFVNLGTAALSFLTVLAFGGVIREVWILAAIQPVIAGMGGNAGTQALAVTVRRLALGQLPREQFAGVVGKEMLVGVANGLALGVTVLGAALVMGQPPMLGLVVFLAMSGNLVVAGFAGAFVPLLLQRAGVDPAIASSVFVTTFTDVCGFALLLGLAGALLL